MPLIVSPFLQVERVFLFRFYSNFGFHFHFSCKDGAARHHGATVREGDVSADFSSPKVISFMFIKSSARTLAVPHFEKGYKNKKD